MTGGWTLLAEDEASVNWNAQLARLTQYSPFQSFEWGRYQNHLGWRPLYYVCRPRGREVQAMCLALLRRYPGGIGFVWCVGGRLAISRR